MAIEDILTEKAQWNARSWLHWPLFSGQALNVDRQSWLCYILTCATTSRTVSRIVYYIQPKCVSSVVTMPVIASFTIKAVITSNQSTRDLHRHNTFQLPDSLKKALSGSCIQPFRTWPNPNLPEIAPTTLNAGCPVFSYFSCSINSLQINTMSTMGM